MAPPVRTITVALDMSKAVNTINIRTLIRELLQTNIPGTLINFIANYIKGRKAYTTYRNHISSQRQFKTGIPQGGVLSPTLFNIAYIPPPRAPVQVVPTTTAYKWWNCQAFRPANCRQHIPPNRFFNGFPDPSQFAAVKLTHYSSKPQRPSDSSRSWQRILLSGDVHPNPTTKYPSPACARNVTSRGVSYLCNRCSGWVHSKCSGLQNAAEYRRTKDWVCSSCNSPPTLPKLQPPPIPTQAVNENSFTIMQFNANDIGNKLTKLGECITNLLHIRNVIGIRFKM